MANPVFDEWLVEQQQRSDDVGELSTRLLNNPTFEQDFYFSNTLSQKLEWMFNQDYPHRDVLNLVRAFEEWLGDQTVLQSVA